MTLQNGLALGDRAMLWTDTAATDFVTGKVIEFQPKAFATTCGVPAAVSMTVIGARPAPIVEFVARHALAYFRLGDLLEACELAVRQFVAGQPQSRVARLLVAGWCHQTDSARLFSIASDAGVAGKPFEAVEVDHYVSSANASAAYQLGIANGLRPDHMLTIAEAQRAEPIDPEFAGIAPYFGIGGALVELEISETGVSSRVAREWGDVAGERIEPSRMAA